MIDQQDPNLEGTCDASLLHSNENMVSKFGSITIHSHRMY